MGVSFRRDTNDMFILSIRGQYSSNDTGLGTVVGASRGHADPWWPANTGIVVRCLPDDDAVEADPEPRFYLGLTVSSS